MVDWVVVLLLLLAGFIIGFAKIIFSLKGDLPDITTTLFLAMGWFQGSIYSVQWVELIIGQSLIGSSLTAFIGITSLVLSLASYHCLQKINLKYQTEN